MQVDAHSNRVDIGKLRALRNRIAAHGDDARMLAWQAAAVQAQLSCDAGDIAAGSAELETLRTELGAAQVPAHVRNMLLARAARCAPAA